MLENIEILKFGATWCGPCRQTDAQLALIQEEYPSLKDKVRKLDIEDEEGNALASAFKIRGVPTIIVLENGTEKIRWVGAGAGSSLRLWLNTIIEPENTDVTPVIEEESVPALITYRYPATITLKGELLAQMPEGEPDEKVKSFIDAHIRQIFDGAGYEEVDIQFGKYILKDEVEIVEESKDE